MNVINVIKVFKVHKSNTGRVSLSYPDVDIPNFEHPFQKRIQNLAKHFKWNVLGK